MALFSQLCAARPFQKTKTKYGRVANKYRQFRANVMLSESFRGHAGARAFAFPFVIFAEQGLMFFYLRFDLVESFFAAGAEVLAGCGGVERAGGKGEIQRQ